MIKDPVIYLKHIQTSIWRIADTISGIREETFANNYQIHDVVIHELEVIGEACRNLEKEFIDTHPEIPWSQIIASRNLLIHEYWGVDLAEVWHTATQDLPKLHDQIAQLIDSE